jgi:hypothetical protein
MSNKNIFKLTEDNPKENLEKYLRPQWSWKTITFIILTIALLTVVTIDLEINFINLFKLIEHNRVKSIMIIIYCLSFF